MLALTPIVAVAACTAQNHSTPLPHLLTLESPMNSWMLSAANGRIISENACVKIDRGNAKNQVLLFPPGYTMTSGGASPEILDQKGRFWAHIGEIREVGGGPLHVDLIDTFITADEQSKCKGPYWIVKPDDPADYPVRDPASG